MSIMKLSHACARACSVLVPEGISDGLEEIIELSRTERTARLAAVKRVRQQQLGEAFVGL